MDTINYDGYNISIDCYCKAPLRISCSIGRYINSRLVMYLFNYLQSSNFNPLDLRLIFGYPTAEILLNIFSMLFIHTRIILAMLPLHQIIFKVTKALPFPEII